MKNCFIRSKYFEFSFIVSILIFLCCSNLVYADECFLSDTMIRMSNGSLKPIENIQIGDIVRGQTQDNTVVDLYHFNLGNQPVYSINNGRYFVTDAHPFMTTDGWKAFNVTHAKQWNPDLAISQLGLGDMLLTDTGIITISTIKKKPYPVDTDIYNFVLDGDKTYYADDYLVHNKGGGGGGGGGDDLIPPPPDPWVTPPSPPPDPTPDPDPDTAPDPDTDADPDTPSTPLPPPSINVEGVEMEDVSGVRVDEDTVVIDPSKNNRALPVPDSVDAGFVYPNINETDPYNALNEIIVPDKPDIALTSPDSLGFPYFSFDPASSTTVHLDSAAEITGNNYHATNVVNVNLVVESGGVVAGSITGGGAGSTVTIEDMDVSLEDGEELSFVVVNDKVYLDINGDDTTVTDHDLDLACAIIAPGSRYRYVGGVVDTFGIWVPSDSSDFELCIRSDPAENYDRSCFSCGYLDFVSDRGFMNGYFELEKFGYFFTDIVDADGTVSGMFFDSNFEELVVSHQSRVVDFNSGSINVFYNGIYGYRFYSYQNV